MLSKPEIFSVASEMYRVLDKHALCACVHKWQSNDRVLVKECQRCKVMATWENMTGKVPHARVTAVKPKDEEPPLIKITPEQAVAEIEKLLGDSEVK
jgi:hypothetical protein